MSTTPLRAVIFDIGRVLIKVNVARAMQGLSENISLSPEELWSAIEKDPRWPDWQEGRMAARDWHLHLMKRLGGSLSFEQFTECWNRALDPSPIQNNSLFEQLSSKYRLALLSNTDPIHVAHMESTFEFFKYFPKASRNYSCVVGASKPSPVIYQQALRSVKAKAEESVFIDDILDYVEAARRLGLQGIQFRAPEQLVTDLNALGAGISTAP